MAQTPKGWLVKGPKINQYVGTVSHLTFNYCKWKSPGRLLPKKNGKNLKILKIEYVFEKNTEEI